MASAILKYLKEYNNMLNEDMEVPVRAKKRRLDHLSWDEKIQRKKLKNRVAAQTSRDRKKAKMEQMEGALNELFTKNDTLLAECENLKAINQRLNEENTALYNKLKEPCLNCMQNRSGVCETESGSAESLLRPRGTVTHSAATLQTQSPLLKIVLACLLYQTCSMNSTTTSTLTLWNNSHRASLKISQETWKLLLRRQIVKNQSLLNQANVKKWWGKHQKSWNPVGVLM